MKLLSTRGTVLGVTIVMAIAFAVAALSVLGLASHSHRLTMRNQVRAEARAVAESELEAIYYQFKTELAEGIEVKSIPARMTIAADSTIKPSTVRTAHFTPHSDANWRIRRSIRVADEAHTGGLANSTKVGTFTTIDVKVEVTSPEGDSFNSNPVFERVGRLFVASTASIFQSCVFFQGTDLEMAPDGDVVISGDIVANGSVFLGAKGSLTLKGNVTYLQGYGFNTNAGADETFDTDDDTSTTRKPGTGNPGGELNAPIFENGQANQLKVMKEPENLIGGANAAALREANPDLFPTLNDVYRSLLAPPPEAGNANEYTAEGLKKADDPVIAAQRLYNRATLLVTVQADNAVKIEMQQKVSGVLVKKDVTSDIIGNVLTAFDPSTGAPKVYDPSKPNATRWTKEVVDYREDSTGVKKVRVVEVDVSKLTAAVAAAKVANSDLAAFDGVMYVNHKSGSASHDHAVRLVNGETTPRTGPDGDRGFSVATNGGVYVKGSYNTTMLTDASGNKSINPAMVMGDMVTVLSDGWDDANAGSADVSANRKATSTRTDASGSPITEIYAGLLTGSTPPTSTTTSGGVQNLVRYLEDWTKDQHVISFKGSLGRLFDSKMFNSTFIDPSKGHVYRTPKQRLFSFNDEFVLKSPPGSPEIARLERGRYYHW